MWLLHFWVIWVLDCLVNTCRAYTGIGLDYESVTVTDMLLMVIILDIESKALHGAYSFDPSIPIGHVRPFLDVVAQVHINLFRLIAFWYNAAAHPQIINR